MDDETPPPFGQRLRGLREAARLSPSQLAANIGIGENAIRKLEKGQSNEPVFTNGVRMADALGVTPHALAGLPERAPDLYLTMRDGTVAAVEFKKAGSGDPLSAAATLAEALKGIAEVRATPPAATPNVAEMRPHSRDLIPALAESVRELQAETALMRERLESLERPGRARARVG